MPEMRRDPVLGRWVIFSPERLRRPMNYVLQAQLSDAPEDNPFLPGNEAYTPPEVFSIRTEGTHPNQPGWQVRVVPNVYPALRVEGDLNYEADGFYDRMNGIGAHEVVIETPVPDRELELQEISEITNILKAWKSRMIDLSKDSRFRYIQIFKNHGPLAGASIRHPHSQIIALPVTPYAIKEKLIACKHHYDTKDRNLYKDVLTFERKTGERLVHENAGFTAFCPYASRAPFEVMILPRKQSADFHKTDEHELVLLADAIKKVLAAYRNGLNAPNYNLVIQTAPLRRPRKDYWDTIDQDFRWHIEIIPRVAGLAGFEFGTGCYINPTLPEEAARFLREVKPDV